jgi:glycoprotein-N-acetylgalactosamine 3-beta-galactosyltransferase
VAATLRTLGVYPKKSIDDLGRERFHPFDVESHLTGNISSKWHWIYKFAANPLKKGIECCSDTTISFHYITPNIMIKLYSLWNKYRQETSSVNFTSILYDSIT